MSFTLRSSSTSFINKNERLKRKRLTITTLNRYSSFNENKSSTVDNRRRLFQLTPNLIELLEEDEDDIDDNQGLCHECNTCSKLFASEYGVNHHINMYHPNQSILCSHCQITFHSHRSLKTHQQRRHSSIHTKLNSKHLTLPNYSYISSYLVSAFSSKQFPIIAKIACEQQRLPLGYLSSKLYQCHLCLVSFPCLRTLKYHLLNKHEQYEYKTCEKMLSNLILQVEFNLRTVNDNIDDDDNDDNNNIEAIKLILAKQASYFGLIDKQLSKKFRSIKIEQNHFIYPKCQHKNRTCANLCLENLSSYSKLIENYPYTIPKLPKGSAFSQGSIVSKPSSINIIYSNDSLSTNDSNSSNDLSNGRQKRKSIKHTDSSTSSSSPVKKKIFSNVTITNSKTNRINSNNKLNVKQQIEQTTKTNETKSVSLEQPSFALAVTSASSLPRKILPKDNYMRSSSMSSNSSTSTRSLTTKSSSSSTNLTQQATISSQRASKRSLSPSITISLEKPSQKRHQTRKQRQNIASSSSAIVIRIDDNENNMEQENDDDDNDDNNDNDDDDVVPIEFEQPKQQRQIKQRHTSGSSIEYVQTLNNDQQSTSSSLNNIENIKSKSKSKINDEEIIICRSPPSVRRVISSSNKNSSKTSINGNGTRKSNIQQSPTDDQHVRVRCKICGEILEGRGRFSQHVITTHSHLLKKNINESKQQQTAIVR
ncbi:unnamed protein product [Rotaria sp. Silwood2]|nr:unnamed protein product [Rotaria sp. Silwood2]CAF2491880.1 unnamed protein product [Rotaria sp. Silwood2]CAF2721725.1 unnamed protein product [Rotaria sp. Silwood2]CAF2891558.1 unnamed protein product [Rotaria sp. Silwood2]